MELLGPEWDLGAGGGLPAIGMYDEREYRDMIGIFGNVLFKRAVIWRFLS